MTQDKVDMFIMSAKESLPADKVVFLREKLLNASEEKLTAVSCYSLKNPTTYLLVSIFLGGLGVDRFMLGQTGMGILKLLTGGVCGLLWIYDFCTIMGKVKEKNYNDLMSML